MKTAQSHGFVFLQFLIVLALVSTLSLYCGWHGMKILRQSSDYAHAFLAEHEAQEKILAAAADSALVSESTALNCRELSARHADIELTRRLCMRINLGMQLLGREAILEGSALKRKDFFPQFNYNQIFRNFTSCSYSSVQSTQNTPSQFRLSPASSVSKNICKMTGNLESPASVYSGNLIAEEEINVSSEIQMLAAAGYIDFANAITVNGNSIIVGGGDVRLKRLTAPAPAQVTLLSATGIVMVEEIAGPVELRAIAWQGVFLPENASLTTHANLPPLLSESLLSLAPAIQP